MVDSPSAMKKTFTVPEIKPLDKYDISRARICASVRWLLSKSYGSAGTSSTSPRRLLENVPVELREPLYKDQYEQEHLKPSVTKLLLSPEIYCRTQALLAQGHGGSRQASQGSLTDNLALLQFLIKKGFSPKVQEADVTEEDLSKSPINAKAHLALIDSLMSLSAREMIGQVKMAAEAEQIGIGAPWENALLFWVNRQSLILSKHVATVERNANKAMDGWMLNQKLRESTEEEELPKSQTCSDLQPVQETCQSNRWYWKLVPIRYRKDKVQSKLTPTFPLVSAVKDLSNGCAIAAVLHYYCPSLLPLEDVCLKDTMSVADSVYNLQMIKEFCESNLQSCCPLAVEDLLYAPPALHLNIMSFIAELLEWFEVKKPDFVKPIQPIDLTDVSGLLSCTSPVSGNSNSGSPSFIFKQPFVPISSPVSPESKSWTKKQISRPLSAVTFSIPFGLDSDVDIVMGNPIDSVFRSVSTDNLTTGIPALSSPAASAGMIRVPFSPPEELSHLVSASAPLQHSSWIPYAQTAPLGELPTIEEARQVVHIPGSKDKKKGRLTEKNGREVLTGRPEPRLCPEGAPAGFFLHSPEEDSSRLSSSAPCRSVVQYRPVRGNVENAERQGRRERSGKHSDMSRDDDSVLRDGSIDSSEASDDAPRNAPGNIRPSNGKGTHNNNSPHMTSFAERRDNRRRHPATPGEESTSAPTPTTPGTPHTPSTPASGQQGSPGLRGSEPGSEAWELGARLEEKRKNIEAQKKRIEAIFAKHRQRLGKNAFLQLKRERGEGVVDGAEEDDLTLEERLSRMEEQLRKEEEKDTEKEKPSVSNPPRLEKQVTFSVDSKKGGEKQKGAEIGGEKDVEKGGEKGADKGEGVIVEYNEVVQKLSEALQSLQKDMQKLTEQQQQLMSNQRPRNTPKTTPRSNCKTPPHTPTKTPPRTPTRTPSRSTTKAWVIPAASNPPAASSPSRRTHIPSSSTSPKVIISSSCPAPRTKLHSSSSPRSPKQSSHPHHQAHPRPSELKFPPLNRVLAPTQNVDTIPHLRRVSPSKCQVQTSSSFRIGGLRTPQESPQPAQPLPPDESTSDTGSSETPTQFSLELEQEDAESVGALPVLPQFRQERPRTTGGSSSGAPSECSFESDTLSLSAAYSAGGEGERGDGPTQPCSLIQVSLSSVGEPEGGSDEPIDEGQGFSSDSMSDHTESAAEAARGPDPQQQDPILILNQPTEGSNRSKAQTEPAEDHTRYTETSEPNGEKNEPGTRGGIGFFFKEDAHSEGEMAQRRALLLERQQKRTEELKRRKQWHEQERENRPASSERREASPSNTPPAVTTSPSPTPPATPARRGDFTRGEYERRQQLRIMEDLDKVLKQKQINHPSRMSLKKTRSRPRSMTREETKLSLSPAKGATDSKLTKVFSHSSQNLAATDELGNNGDSTKRPQSRLDSPSRCVTPSRPINQNGDKDWESGSNGTSPAPEFTGPKLFKEPSFKSNKFIIHNALSRCCLAGKVNEMQKNKIVEEMEKSSANHFLILFRDSNCQFRGVYTMNPDTQELVRLAGVGPRAVSSSQVESIFKYSSDRKQFSTIPSKTMGMSVDAFTIPSQLWQGGGGGGAGGGGSRRASVTKKVAVLK
ncbi:calmodulin-regulated spectrin-associated protein 3-like isoform X3 [Girardinichthys multiradiatus]|uniref:calmodulin-regulated spectrin-associated protein 3-like isoform X3 n=1 Tax=Girardinichthys multiradiatus TaxID=208333 RepID=UPI001FACA52D|nr:calmodulin-regulated spectrin-associated protein 3-like isoform X3 [Girardinichthys multiradiatus]